MSLSLENCTLGILGLGKMAEAMIRGMLTEKVLRPDQIIATRRNMQALSVLCSELGINSAPTNEELVSHCDVLLLGIKPQQFDSVLPQLGPHLKAKLVISVAAGLTTTQIEKLLGTPVAVIRAMPNTPALVGRGVTGYCSGQHVLPEHQTLTQTLLEANGSALTIEEHQINALTAISGSGPAYFYLLAESLCAAGQKEGLAPDVAQKLAAETLIGAGMLLAARDLSPRELRAEVTSPNGVTEAAVNRFEEEGLHEMVHSVVRRAIDRGQELAKGKG